MASLSYNPVDAIRLSRLTTGFVGTQLVYVAAKLGLADHLAAGPRSAGDLADLTGAVEARLFRVLRALASLGVVSEAANGQFALTSLGFTLRSDVPESQRDIALMMGSFWHIASWGRILDCVLTERAGIEAQFGETLFEYLEGSPEDSAVFGNAMAFTSRRHSEAIANAYDFSTAGRIVDVGGGHGELLRALLRRNHAPSGLLFDAPSVIARALSLIEAEGLAARCEGVGGDFFDSVPLDGDLYLLKYIIHDWDDERAATILRNCRRAMKPSAKLLIIDAVLPERRAPFGKSWPDVEMMVLLSNGKERTEAEFRDLLDGAELEIRRILSTRSELSVIEAVPAS